MSDEIKFGLVGINGLTALAHYSSSPLCGLCLFLAAIEELLPASSFQVSTLGIPTNILIVLLLFSSFEKKFTLSTNIFHLPLLKKVFFRGCPCLRVACDWFSNSYLWKGSSRLRCIKIRFQIMSTLRLNWPLIPYIGACHSLFIKLAFCSGAEYASAGCKVSNGAIIGSG